MAELVTVKNGVKNPRKRKTTRRRKRRNPVARKRTTAKRRVTRRNPAPKRRVTKRSKNNGLLGDTKATVKAVTALGAGMLGTKIVAGVALPFVAPTLSKVGLGGWGRPIVEAVVALPAKSIGAMAGGREAGKFAMLGGLSVALLSALEEFLPAVGLYNPFSGMNQPIMVGGLGAQDVAQLVNATVDETASETKAKIAGALSGGGNSYYDEYDEAMY